MMDQDTELKVILTRIVTKSGFTLDQSKKIFKKIIENDTSDFFKASILVGLSIRGESINEIHSLIQVINENSIKISPKIRGSLIDTCGTGGDKIKTFNISTAAAIVASAAGCKIAKHGNRSSSGMYGSADFLEYIGLDLTKSPDSISKIIGKIGLGFLFAPIFHPALKSLSKIRRNIGIRTIFNIAAPLCNPCTNLTGQVIGVYDLALLKKLTEVTKKIDKRFMIVYSEKGFDEITNTGLNSIVYLHDGKVSNLNLNPKDVDIPITSIEKISINNKEESVKLTLQSIYGTAKKEIEDIVVLNSAAALVVSNIARNFKEGIEISRTVIKEEKARKKLENFIDLSGNIKKLREVEKDVFN